MVQPMNPTFACRQGGDCLWVNSLCCSASSATGLLQQLQQDSVAYTSLLPQYSPATLCMQKRLKSLLWRPQHNV